MYFYKMVLIISRNEKYKYAVLHGQTEQTMTNRQNDDHFGHISPFISSLDFWLSSHLSPTSG